MPSNILRTVSRTAQLAREQQLPQQIQERRKQAEMQIQVLGEDLTGLSQQQIQQRYGYNSVADLISARKRKTSQMSGYLDTQQRGRGISSLIGRGTTLG